MNENELKELNNQLDAIRKDPLLIFDASDEVKQAAANVKIYYDWAKDTEVWDEVRLGVNHFSGNQEFDLIDFNNAANSSLRSRYDGFKQRVMNNDPSDLISSGNFFRNLEKEILVSAEGHSKIEAVYEYYKVPISDAKEAKSMGLELDNASMLWRKCPTKDLTWVNHENHFEKVAPPKQKPKSLSSGIEM